MCRAGLRLQGILRGDREGEAWSNTPRLLKALSLSSFSWTSTTGKREKFAISRAPALKLGFTI